MESQRSRSEFEPVDVSTAEAQLADRLDRLSVPLAENVLQRAIDLHQEQIFEDNSITWDRLEKVGAELGIDPTTLRKALLAELETEKDPPEPPGIFSKLVGPPSIKGGIIAESDRDDLERRLDEWMRSVEGMAPVSRNGDSITWEASQSTMTSIRRARALFKGAESGDLRNMGPVTTRITEVANGDQLIEISVDTERVSDQAKAVVAASGIVGLVLAAVIVFAASTFLGGLVGFLAAMGVSLGAGAVAAYQSAKYWTRKIRTGINRALDGMVHATTLKKRKKKSKKEHSKRPRWMEIVEEIFDEVFD